MNCSEPFYCGLCPCHYPQTGATALWQASFRGHTEVADLLLKAKASVDTPSNDASQVVFEVGARVVPVACLPTCTLSVGV